MLANTLWVLAAIAALCLVWNRKSSGLWPFKGNYLMGRATVRFNGRFVEVCGLWPFLIGVACHIAGYAWFGLVISQPNSLLNPPSFTLSQVLLSAATSIAYLATPFAMFFARLQQLRG